MKSVYVLGPAGSGKSTLVAGILEGGGFYLGEGRIVHTYTGCRLGKPVPVTISGHEMTQENDERRGEYLGVMREEFPGTDGLTANCSVCATDWVLRGAGGADRLLVEGAKLATRRFLAALDVESDLLILALDAPDEVLRERRENRPEKTPEENAKRTETRFRSLTDWLEQGGFPVRRVDTSSGVEFKAARGKAIVHLGL